MSKVDGRRRQPAHRLRQGLITKGSFAKPCIVTRLDFDASGLPTLTAEERADELASADRKRFDPTPEILDEYDTLMLNDITACIDDEDTIDDIDEQHR